MPVLVQMENGKERCVACGLEQTLPRPSQAAPVPPALDAVVLRCMEKTAERRFHDPSQAIVETHGRKVGRGTAGDGFTGRRVDQLVGSVANENPLALRAEEKPPILEGGDHRRRERIAAGDDPVNALDRLIEAVGAETRQRVLVWPRLRARRQGGKQAEYEHANREHERDEAIAEGKHSDRPGIRARRPNIRGLGRLDSCYQRNATLLRNERYDAPPHFLVALL